MKMPIAAIAAAALSLALSAPAWAGSAAVVDQVGDGNYSIVAQKGDKTIIKTGTATGALAQAAAKKKVDAFARLASTPGKPATGKAGGGKCGYNAGGYANKAFATQTGIGNKASATQYGAANIAAMDQAGNGNVSHVVQRGFRNEAYTSQLGNNNASVVIQAC